MYPRLVINTEKYRYNVNRIQNLCHRHGLSMMAVTKVYCAAKPLTQVLREEKVDYIADSRLINLKRISTTIPKVLLRLVSLHEVDEVVNVTDISLNSELSVIKALNKAAEKYNQEHGVILMVDIGDLREGIYYKENLDVIIEEMLKLKHVYLKGIGTNLTCYGGIIPTQETLKKLINIVSHVEEKFKISIDVVSGGNSSHLHLLNKDIHIEKINNLRIGEAIALGRETAYGEQLETLYNDVFTLETDIIELKKKPSIPEGDIGMDAFGKKPRFTDLGVINRAILGIGRQDVDYYELIPYDKHVRLIGSSSDHIIAGLTDTENRYKVGDVVRFKVTYGSLLSLMTSEYVEKYYVQTI